MKPLDLQRIQESEGHIVILSRYLRHLVRAVFKNTMGRRVNAKSRQLTPTEYLDFQGEMDKREQRMRRKRKDSEVTPNPRTAGW